MGSNFRLALTLGAVAALAFAIPACGSDDDPKPATGGTGATGGGGTGGTGGGAAGNAGTAGSAGGAVVCGGDTCPAYNVGGLVPVAACCSDNDKCGSEVSQTISGLLGNIPTGCYESGQAGDLDCACPGYTFNSPLPPNDPVTFPGCCTPSGACGYGIDISSQSGPVIGCQEATWGDGMGETCTVGSPDLSCHADGGAGAGGGSGDASTD